MTIPEEIAVLKTQLEVPVSTTERAALLHKLLALHSRVNSSDGEPYIKQLKHCAEELNSAEYAAWVHYYQDYSFKQAGHYHKAIEEGKYALEIFREIGHGLGAAMAENSIGIMNFLLGNYPEALSCFMGPLAFYESTGDKRSLANSYTNIGSIYLRQTNFTEALSNYTAAIEILEELGLDQLIAATYVNIGTIHVSQTRYKEALDVFNVAIPIFDRHNDEYGVALVLISVGEVYQWQGDLDGALDKYLAALSLYKKNNDKRGMATASTGLGKTNIIKGEYEKAGEYLEEALKLGNEIGAKYDQVNTLKTLYELKKAQGDSALALDYYERYVETDKEMLNEETSKKIAGMQFGYQIEKKEQEVAFERQKKEALQTAYDLLDKEKQRSEALLLNILPAEVADELKEKGTAEAKLFDNVTVLFTDFKGFTNISARLSPQQIVNELHECFKAFDEIMEKYNIEKIKTMGDAYMAVSGLPTANPRHAEDMINAALEIRDFMDVRRAEGRAEIYEVRIGVHSGYVVAGIVGVKKFAYDIWGDTVNTAARMEQHGEAGKVNISEVTYELVAGKFKYEYRGEVEAKNKGKLKMYFADKKIV